MGVRDDLLAPRENPPPLEFLKFLLCGRARVSASNAGLYGPSRIPRRLVDRDRPIWTWRRNLSACLNLISISDIETT